MDWWQLRCHIMRNAPSLAWALGAHGVHLQARLMQGRFLMALVLAAGIARPATAQFPTAVAAGVRIHVRVSPPGRGRLELWSIHWLRGTVTRLSSDTLFLDSTDRPGVYAIPRGSIERLEVSAGRRSRAQSAMRCSLVGAAGSLLLFSALPELSAGAERRHGQLMVDRALTGAVVGMAVGALVPLERWRRVPLKLPVRHSTVNRATNGR